MGSGCVVLASNIENNLEIITNKKNGYTFELKDRYLLDLFNNILSKMQINSVIPLFYLIP